VAKEDPFAGLPEISFAQVDIAALQAQVIQGFQTNWLALTGEQLNLTLADRRANFLYSLTYYLVQEHMLIDASAKQNLLPYSLGGFLDALGIFFDTERLPAAPAIVTLEFTLDQVYTTGLTVPAGTTVTSQASGLVFATDIDLTIAAGYQTGSTQATCTTPGPQGNGLLDINQVVGWTITGFYVTAQNLVASTGGADVETDEAFRIRLLGATDSYSPAGPKGRYRYYTLGVSSDITDVSVLGPEDGLDPGNVQVVVLLQDGVFPDGTMLQKVYDALNTDTVRDLCAYVTVTAPSGVPYTTSVRYWIDDLQSPNQVLIETNVTNAVNNWITDNKTGLGGSINPATLSQAVMEAGASYCIIDSPPRIALNLAQVGVLTDDPIINYEGLESDLQPLLPV
jgi:phage-related baseplate assembly protein